MPSPGSSTPGRARASLGSARPNWSCLGPSTFFSIIINSLHFGLETALYYLALRNISKKWTIPIQNWKAALNRFTIMFGERMPQH
jgi:hypothetical protein